MDLSTNRRAHRIGLIVKKCRRATVLIDPVTNESLYVGNRSHRSFHKEKEIQAFLRRRERGGVG